jgi:hypothetical protein
VPAVVGGVVLLHAAVTRGPISAFRLVSRRVHRVVDLFVIGFEVVAAVQPLVSVEVPSRVILGGFAAVHLLVWLQSSFAERVPAASKAAPAPPADDLSTTIGRHAGRLAGSGVNAIRRARARRSRN